MIYHWCSKRRPNRPQRRMKRLRLRKWREFKVEIWNYGGRNRLKYEWRLIPLTNKAFSISADRKGRFRNIIYDPTSTYCPKESWFDARCRINEFHDGKRRLNIDFYFKMIELF